MPPKALTAVRTHRLATHEPPPQWLARAARLGLRDVCFLAPRFLGTSMLLTDPEVVMRVENASLAGGRDAVLRLLACLDAAWGNVAVDEQGHALGAAVLLLGYEASCSLDARAPVQRYDPRLGPDAELRVYRSGIRMGPGGAEGFYVGRQAPPSLAQLLSSLAEDNSAGPRSTDAEHKPLVALASPFVARVQAGEQVRHEERVRRCRDALYAGALYQANLAHRLNVAPCDYFAGAQHFATRVSSSMPPFAAFWDTSDFGSLVSLSPECFFAFDLPEQSAKAFPIKGTRPRGKSPEEDLWQRDELQRSEKDAAEHVMIVDLLRNDLGRVATRGGVSVEQLVDVVSVANVHHLESTIAAHLRPEVRLSELVSALSPGGSITGAPKSAAIEWIHRLESGPRGPYTGTLLACDGRGRGAASILIRTWVRPDTGAGALHVGGGVVVDSDPRTEWEETLQKARAFSTVHAPSD